MNYMGCYSDSIISDLEDLGSFATNEMCGELCYNRNIKKYAATQYK